MGFIKELFIEYPGDVGRDELIFKDKEFCLKINGKIRKLNQDIKRFLNLDLLKCQKSQRL